MNTKIHKIMRQTLYISLFSILCLAYSCDLKTLSKFSETKESVMDRKDQTTEITSIRHTSSTQLLTQTQLFENMVDAMVLNDTATYDMYIAKFKNIDTLVYFSPSDDEEKEYYSLLGLACRSNSLYVMKDLVLRGANIELGSEDEFSTRDALYYAILGGNAEMVKILIDKKADLNAIYTETGITPLILAVLNKKYVMAEILLQAGAKVNGVGNLGFDYVLYPLHDAIRLNDVEMVKILLKYNANVNLKDHEGLTALDLAKQMKSKEIIALLTK